jgi:hypothetical protein
MFQKCIVKEGVEIALQQLLYNNILSDVIVNAASKLSYRPLIQTDVFAVIFMNEFKNLTNVVIGKIR